MLSYESIRLKLVKLRRDMFAKTRTKKITNKTFTIISNNCWGGTVYESYALKKQSPTVGLFFVASDYIKFLKRLAEYLAAPLTFISPEDSRHKLEVKGGHNFGKYPVGVLSLNDESVEIFFLHYHSEEEAKEKWERRLKRVDADKLIVKFNDQNACTEKDAADFAALPFKHKLFFTVNKQWAEKYGGIFIKQLGKNEHVMASYEPFGKNRYVDIDALINNL